MFDSSGYSLVSHLNKEFEAFSPYLNTSKSEQ